MRRCYLLISSTGKKEGKLLEKDEPSKALIATENRSEEVNHSDELKNSKKRLEAALKNIPHESFDYDEREIKKITKKYKSYETLKKEFADLNMNVRTDYELLDQLLVKFNEMSGKESISDAEIDAIFEDLEYLVHQIDNANRFIFSGGLDKIILPNVQNQTNSQLKRHSVKLLGTLTQNNPKAQIAAFEKNLGFVLLQVLAQSSDIQEMSSVIYAFGSLVRKFPLAQKELLNKPGLKILIDLLGKNVDYKIKIKMLKLITDLIREYDEVTQFESEFDKEKLQQYKEVNIKERLEETQYCNAIDELSSENRHEYLQNLYATDDMLGVISVSKEICQPNWSSSPIFRHTILVIKNKYDRMFEDDKQNEELGNVVRTLQDLDDFLFKEEEEETESNEI